MRRALALALLVALTAAAPARAQDAEPPPPVIAEGVTIAGVAVGGLTAEEAAAAVQAAFDRPFAFTFKSSTWERRPVGVGARAEVAAAVAEALVAPPLAELPLDVRVRTKVLRRYVARLARKYFRPARNSTVLLRNLRPFITEARPGRKVRRRAMRIVIWRALAAHERGPLELQVRALEPRVTRANFGPVVVIRRESKRLHLYRGTRPWATFGVATGLASYPTPLGKFRIVTKQRNPWWYPPNAGWASGSAPIPPGPRNPLGTRWMGLSVGAVGIHGTPNSGSIGYSASHGCIRMHIPQAEWLFERVRVGTTVFIVRA